jgi:hypothetical protein
MQTQAAILKSCQHENTEDTCFINKFSKELQRLDRIFYSETGLYIKGMSKRFCRQPRCDLVG